MIEQYKSHVSHLNVKSRNDFTEDFKILLAVPWLNQN